MTAETGRADGPKFVPIRAKRAFEEVCEQIRREVEFGRLKPGDRLPPEREFAEQLGVSRTALREAMRSLENAGIIECHQGMGGGALIRERSSIALTQVVGDMVMLGQIPASSVTEARILLTEQAIRLACERATEEDLDAIERDIDRTEQLTHKGNFDRRNAYITEFYGVLAQGTHNQVIVMLIESLTELTRAMLAKGSPYPRADVIPIRREVLRLMRARDADEAVLVMRGHLQRVDDLFRRESEESTGAS